MSHYCAKCQSPLLGGSHICPTCGFDNALGIMPTEAAPAAPSDGASGPDGSAPSSTGDHPAHHEHTLEYGSIAPLSAKPKWGDRVLIGAIALAVLVIVGYGYWNWNRVRLAVKIEWPSQPQALAGLPTGGLDFSCLITRDGAVWCWGNNETGQLGDTMPVRTGQPLRVRAGGTFTQVDAGDSHACARATDGTVQCWGSNALGQLGVTTTTACKTEHGTVPCSVLPVAAPVTEAAAVTAGAEHTCALGKDGTATCWGANSRGQLGVSRQVAGTLVAQLNPRLHFIALSAGGYHTCGILTDGSLMCWGWNRYAQLGSTASMDGCGPTLYSRTSCALEPVRSAPGLTLMAVAAGGEHTCALTRDGAAWCWGANNRGQVGNGAVSDSVPAPVQVPGERRYTAIGAGQDFTCGLARGGSVWCWGDASVHQFGTEDSTFSATPVQVPLPETALSLGVGAQHACVVTVNLHAVCWGAGEAGQIGKGAIGLAGSRLREAGPSQQGAIAPGSTERR